METAFCEVAVALPVHGTYTYRLPAEQRSSVDVGSRVWVPFGTRRATGYVLAPGGEPREDAKPIDDLLDATPLFPASMVPFFRWVSSYYLHPLGEVIKAALPGGLTLNDVTLWHLAPAGTAALEGEKVPAPERAVLQALKTAPLRRREIEHRGAAGAGRVRFDRLVQEEWIVPRHTVRGGRTRPRQERFVRLNRQFRPLQRLSSPKLRILELLEQRGESRVADLSLKIPTASRHIGALVRTGHLTATMRPVYRDPFGEPVSPEKPPRLSPAQAVVVGKLVRRLGCGFHTFVLAGVTGSGKTEVYLRLAARAMKRGLNVLVLVPEIALITAMEHRFRARFGERVALLHSRLSAGERFDQWLRVQRGEAAVVVGARSAVFAPFDRLGLIVVDEEHDGSYKQEGGLRYQARDLAVVRAREAGALALLGSATPAMQTWHNVETGRFTGLRLEERIHKRPLPVIELVDLRQSRDERGTRRFFTPRLREAMKETLASGHQVLLFLNRRGFATFPVCGSCGASLNCRNCDVTLTLHQEARAYRCHYCGWSLPQTARCPQCNAERIRPLGLGTEKVAAAAQALFPEARVVRMDRDTTRRKGAIVDLLKQLKQREIDILIGTQMVAKGHDFPSITLVGIICADLSLNFPDFRAGERTFQLLAQVAGRAGRGPTPGRVVLQTYAPEHFSIQAARSQDFTAFYQQEISFRRALGYPPFSRLVQIRVSGRDVERVEHRARDLGTACRRLRNGSVEFRRDLEILGPVDSPLSRVAGRYRWQLLLKGRGPSLRRFTRRLAEAGITAGSDRVRVSLDVDPYSML